MYTRNAPAHEWVVSAHGQCDEGAHAHKRNAHPSIQQHTCTALRNHSYHECHACIWNVACVHVSIAHASLNIQHATPARADSAHTHTCSPVCAFSSCAWLNLGSALRCAWRSHLLKLLAARHAVVLSWCARGAVCRTSVACTHPTHLPMWIMNIRQRAYVHCDPCCGQWLRETN